jgi:hypothetical protein
VPSAGRAREEFDREVCALLAAARADLVLLVGFMRILSREFTERFAWRTLNVHPSLLPDFGGLMDLQVHAAVLAAKAPVSGCTVHFVDAGVDTGAVLWQEACAVDAARDQNVFMPEKTNISMIWGQATGLRYGDTDTLALRVGTAALGSGFTGRLMANVRDKEGLTYGIGSYVAGDTFVDGDWRITANFAPEMLAKGVASTKRQLTEWHTQGITDDELAQRKTGLAGTFKVALSTTSGMAGTILATLNRDLELSFIDQYPVRIGALTRAQVNGAIKQHLDPEKMVLVKAGTVPGAK